MIMTMCNSCSGTSSRVAVDEVICHADDWSIASQDADDLYRIKVVAENASDLE